MQILVTGGAGYVGSVLIRHLLEKGYKVKCLDRFFFGEESLKHISANGNLKLIRDDVRWLNPDILDDVDVVIDLAALSNDATGEIDPQKTFDINYLGRVRVAELSKKHGVKKYILASSCSIYGFREEVCDEATPANPLTTYAKASFMAEQGVLPLADSRFTVTVLRFATVYGLSPKMRFDLALNTMTLSLFKTGKIMLTGDGRQWRPFIHVMDVARSYASVIESSSSSINGRIFNVGSDEQNYQLVDLARAIGDSVGIPYEIGYHGTSDFRSYRVSFKEFKKTLNFDVRYWPKHGAPEIFNALNTGKLAESPKNYTVNWYKHLLIDQGMKGSVLIGDKLL